MSYKPGDVVYVMEYNNRGVRQTSATEVVVSKGGRKYLYGKRVGGHFESRYSLSHVFPDAPSYELEITRLELVERISKVIHNRCSMHAVRDAGLTELRVLEAALLACGVQV